MVEGAKAMRRPWRTAAGRHTETRDRRAHQHESSKHRLFWILHEAVLLFATLYFFVVLAEVHTLHKEQSPTILNDVVYGIAVLHLVRHSGKT